MILLLSACGQSSEPDTTEEIDLDTTQQLGYVVEYAGALKNMMHKNDISSKADLLDLKDQSHTYALGAIAELKGELLILDGVPYMAFVQEGQLRIENSFEYEATLIVHTTVEEWKSYGIDTNVQSKEDLEQFVFETAEKEGLDVSEPFPFLVEGVADSLSWHVIDWPEGDTVHTHQKHVESGLNGVLDHIEVEILGFYSDSHHAVFTHHSTNMHMHFNSEEAAIAGHVDDLQLGEKMILKLPKIFK
jgi:acetolactate decarboxylase